MLDPRKEAQIRLDATKEFIASKWGTNFKNMKHESFDGRKKIKVVEPYNTLETEELIREHKVELKAFVDNKVKEAAGQTPDALMNERFLAALEIMTKTKSSKSNKEIEA